jgi:hypothetical protein
VTTTQTQQAPSVSTLIGRLEAFNAKERYWLVRQALEGFRPSRWFLDSIVRAVGLPLLTHEQRKETFCAMDYHLNWIHAALSSHTPAEKKEPAEKEPVFPNSETLGHDGEKRWAIENSQQDVDLLLAYPRVDQGRSLTQLIVIEAKCVGTFQAGQILSKLDRLNVIVEQAEGGHAFDARVVLMCPKDPGQFLKTIDLSRYRSLLSSGSIPFVPLEIEPIDPEGFWYVSPRDPDPPGKPTTTSKDNRVWRSWWLGVRGGTKKKHA